MAEVGRITPEPLTVETWLPFGWLPVADTDPRDGVEVLEFTWGDPHVNLIGHRRDEVPQAPNGLRCQMLYRHATHTQTLMSMDVPAVVVVAPPDVEMDSAGDADKIRAFRLEPLESLVLRRGTWHWGPFPIDAESVTLFNVQGLRYAEDNEMVDLEAQGSGVDVLLD
jgi:ureidoglycolate hydrolase